MEHLLFGSSAYPNSPQCWEVRVTISFTRTPPLRGQDALNEGTQLGSQENGLHAILTQGTALPTLRGLRRDASTSHTPHFAGELRETGRTSRSSEEGAQSEGTLRTTGTQAWGTGVETAA